MMPDTLSLEQTKYHVEIARLDGCWKVTQREGQGRGKGKRPIYIAEMRVYYKSGRDALNEAVEYLEEHPWMAQWEKRFYAKWRTGRAGT